MLGLSLPKIVWGVAAMVMPALIAFFILGSQLNLASCDGTWPMPVISRTRPLYPCCW